MEAVAGAGSVRASPSPHETAIKAGWALCALTSLLVVVVSGGLEAARLAWHAFAASFDARLFLAILAPSALAIRWGMQGRPSRIARTPDEVLVIGDTPLDIACGRAIGARVLTQDPVTAAQHVAGS